MSTESPEPGTTGQSRRSFLVKVGLGVAGLAAMSSGMLWFGKKESASLTEEFPGPDSIFHPAQDPRTDPRRS